MNKCTLVLEFNYGKPRSRKSLGSVWICSGDGTADLVDDEPMESKQNWTKIVGPIDLDEAVAICNQLKQFYLATGVEVIDKGIAD